MSVTPEQAEVYRKIGNIIVNLPEPDRRWLMESERYGLITGWMIDGLSIRQISNEIAALRSVDTPA